MEYNLKSFNRIDSFKRFDKMWAILRLQIAPSITLRVYKGSLKGTINVHKWPFKRMYYLQNFEG